METKFISLKDNAFRCKKLKSHDNGFLSYDQVGQPFRCIQQDFFALSRLCPKKPWLEFNYIQSTPIQENFIYKKQGPSPISMVRATRIFSKAKTLKKYFDLSLAIRDNPIYPF